ncbi:MAG: WD40 repeat domain-containing protein [Pirellulaceae bacterium]|nr:WD40 repeat domain-containing protein [Pirellulaceae bacterium]
MFSFHHRMFGFAGSVQAFLLLVLLLGLVGCGGESTQDAMMRVARQRAQAKADEAAEEAAKLAAQGAATPQASPTPEATAATPEPPTPAPTQPAPAPSAATPAANVSVTQGTQPGAAQVNIPAAVPPATSAIQSGAATNYSIPTNLLSFDFTGHVVAYSGDGNSIGVHDVGTKALVRKAYNDQLTPSSLAIDEKRSILVVGGADGKMKTFSLGSVQGLDRYAQERLLRRDLQPPLKAHSQAITAVAVNSQAKVLATGDLTGELRIWSADNADSINYPGNQGGYVRLRSYQKDLIFGLTKQKQLVFWKTSQASREPAEYAKFTDQPTVMQVGPQGKGLAVGDDSGRVTMWLPEGSELKKQSFQAHGSAVSGIGFTAAGDTLITASRSGELFHWSLPLNSSQTVDLDEAPRFLTTSNNGRLLGVPSRKSFLDVYSAANTTKLRSFQVPGDRRATAGGFTNDNRVTVVGDDAGSLHFFGNANEPFASLIVGTGRVDNIEISPAEDWVASTSQDGTTTVVATPRSDPSFVRTPPIDLAVADEAGTKVLVVSRTGLQVIETAHGNTTRSANYVGAAITAAYIDNAIALLGNDKGEVFSWKHRLDGANPEPLPQVSSSGKPIVSIGLTKAGQVWLCDNEGSSKLTTIGARSEQVSGSFKQSVAKVVVSPSGKPILLSSDGSLSVAASLTEAPSPLLNTSAPKFSDVRIVGSGIIALTDDKRQLVSYSQAGNQTHSVSIAPSHGEIALFDAGELSYSLLTKTGNLLAGVSRQTAGSSLILASGQLRNAQITPDANVIVAETPEGALHISLRGGSSQKIKMANPLRLLALAADGQTILTSADGRVECMQLTADQARVLFGIPSEIKSPTAACFSPNSRTLYLATSDGGIYQVSRNDASKADVLTKLEISVSSLQLNSAGDRMLARSEDGRIVLLGLDGVSAKNLYDSQDQKFTCMSFAGTRILLGDTTGSLHELTENPVDKRELLKLGASALVRLTGDEKGDRCVAETVDKQVHQINLKDGVWYSTPSQSSGECLLLGLRGNMLTRVDTKGNLHSTPTSMAASLLGPESNVRTIATTADGRWLVAADARGKLARWPFSAEGSGKPMRSSLDLTVDEVRAFPTGSMVCLLNKDKGLVSYSPSQDRPTGNIGGKLEAAEIVAMGLDQTVAIKQGDGYAIADFRAGKLEAIEAIQGGSTGLFQAIINEKNTWLSVTTSGDYQSPAPTGSSRVGGDFGVGLKPASASLRNDLLQAQSSDTIVTVRPDGSQLQPFKLPSGQIVASAMGSNSAHSVACDSAGRVWFYGDGMGAPRNMMVPGGAVIKDVMWDDPDSSVVVATEKEAYVIDAVTTKISSVFKTPMPVNSFLCWDREGVWCVGKDQRLFKLKIPKTDWAVKLPSPSAVLAWQANGKEVVCGSAAGTITAFDARTGTQVAKVESGKGELRAGCSLKDADKLLLLAGTSSIMTFDSSHRITSIPISSALQLSGIATDTTGRWLYATNNVGEILAWDMTKIEAAPKTIPCELRSAQIRFVEGGKLATIGNSQPQIAFTPSTASQNSLTKSSGSVEDFAILPDDSFIAIADGSSVIQLAGLVAEGSKQLVGSSIGFRMVSVHPRGVRVAAAGALLGKPGAKLCVWDTADLKPVGEAELPANPIRLTYSADGGLIAVAMDNGECQIFDGASGVLLESLPISPGLNTVEFSEDGRRVLLAKQDGSINSQPLTSMGVAKASDAAISSLSIHGSGKHVYTADASGKITLRSIDSLGQVKATFQGVAAPLLQMKLSSDSNSLLAVFDDAEHSVLLWKLDSLSGMPTSSAPDSIIHSPESRNMCAGFTIDSQFVLLGGEDGLIRAWSVADSREVARFRGHTSAVRDIAPYLEAGRFVSGGVDRSIRTWRFPGNLPRSGDPVPDGALVEATEMQQVTVPTESVSKEEDRLAAAREALISGNPNTERAGEIFSLLSTNSGVVADAKASNSRLRSLERDPQASLNDIYQERIKNSQILQRLLSVDGRVTNSKFENALMQAQTNFRFDAGENARPVKLRFSDRFLYAARPSVPMPPLNPGEPKPDVGDNGALLSWEFRVTQLPSREWLVDQIDVKELFSFPNYGGAIAVPSMTMYSQDDGSSTQLPTASSWDTSPSLPSGKRLFAVGSAGANRAESEILRIYDVAQLKGNKFLPVSRYTSYEGVVTAMAFSNTSSQIAFCVRERAVHRLYVADAERLDSTITLVEEFAHKLPWINVNGQPGAPGITSLAFTPDDRMLVGHGHYDERLYKFSAWKINTDASGSVSAVAGFSRENNLPFLFERSSRPIRFVLRQGDYIMIAENEDRYVVWNITSGESKQIPFLPMQRGLPERSLTEDGRWLIMGDDRGNAYVYDILRSERFSVAFTREAPPVASTIRDKSSKEKAKAVERPAHSGPVAGVALSAPGAHGDFPEFAATIGEENRVIVWDLIPVLGNRPAPPTKSAKRVATQ